MPKKFKTTLSLVIVESPSKCKKIEQYLGPGYKCVATYGHIRELPSLDNIDIKHNFATTYSMVNDKIKKKNLEAIKKEINQANEIILATDDDREGESIAWHICQVFNLDINNTKRIIFHEITESALQKAINEPQKINMNLVNAQQSRQILDVLVGFKITPILWKHINKNTEKSLSAGRCQTPALKLIYDNYIDINNSVESKIYNVTGYFTNLNLPFILNKQIDNEVMMNDFLKKSIDFKHIYNVSSSSKTQKNPPEPITTSRIQQLASNEFHYSPKETMHLCQNLYENGYITYMRTDSKNYSNEFINSITNYIIFNYDSKYINPKLTTMSNDIINENKQCAHEAIRPTNISLKSLPENFDIKEKKIYKLIWTTTLESCMAPALYNNITANITAPFDMKYSYTSELNDFPGWKIICEKFEHENNEYQYLQSIKQQLELHYKKINAKMSFKGNKIHYTEARLVQLLEEKGIGRPSTFSSIVDKIQERGYVKKDNIKGKEIICKDYELNDREIYEIEEKREFGNEKNKLLIQPLGIIVIEFLNKHFNSIFNYEYTCNMEIMLDKISNGNLDYYNLCNVCNNEIDNLIKQTNSFPKYEVCIDDNNKCIIGKYGPVIKCIENTNGNKEIKFKQIKKDIDIIKLNKGEYNLDDIIENNKPINNVVGQYDNKDVILCKGKYGLYVNWGENTKSLKELGNRPSENITFDEIKAILNKGSNIVREISDNISIRSGPKGDYLFFKNIKMKKPCFFNIINFTKETKEDYKLCDINMLKIWIQNKYNIQY